MKDLLALVIELLRQVVRPAMDVLALVALMVAIAIAGGGLAWALAAQRQADALAGRMNRLEMENTRLSVEAAACVGQPEPEWDWRAERAKDTARLTGGLKGESE